MVVWGSILSAVLVQVSGWQRSFQASMNAVMRRRVLTPVTLRTSGTGDVPFRYTAPDSSSDAGGSLHVTGVSKRGRLDTMLSIPLRRGLALRYIATIRYGFDTVIGGAGGILDTAFTLQTLVPFTAPPGSATATGRAPWTYTAATGSGAAVGAGDRTYCNGDLPPAVPRLRQHPNPARHRPRHRHRHRGNTHPRRRRHSHRLHRHHNP